MSLKMKQGKLGKPPRDPSREDSWVTCWKMFQNVRHQHFLGVFSMLHVAVRDLSDSAVSIVLSHLFHFIFNLAVATLCPMSLVGIYLGRAPPRRANGL